MNAHNFSLGDEIQETTENTVLWQTEDGIVQTEKGTLTIPITTEDNIEGYIFHGHAKLVLDTIVETREGAIGKPVERTINETFLMLGNTNSLKQKLTTANPETLKKSGFKNEQEFMTDAKNLFDLFLGKVTMHNGWISHSEDTYIFAFPNMPNRLDKLIAKNHRIIYKAADKVFVKSKNKIVLKTPNDVIIRGYGSSLIVKKCCHT